VRLIDYHRPVRSLLLGALGLAAVACLLILAGTRQHDEVKAALGYGAGGVLLLLGGYFVFGAFYFASGRASASQVDPSYRAPRSTVRILRSLRDLGLGRRKL
jgi:hypothetical protein